MYRVPVCICIVKYCMSLALNFYFSIDAYNLFIIPFPFLVILKTSAVLLRNNPTLPLLLQCQEGTQIQIKDIAYLPILFFSPSDQNPLKLKFKSSLDRLRRFFNLGGWTLVPNRERLPPADSFSDDSGSFDESVSLMSSSSGSRQSLNLVDDRQKENLQQQSQKLYSHQQNNLVMGISRKSVQLIDDEVPLIKF